MYSPKRLLELTFRSGTECVAQRQDTTCRFFCRPKFRMVDVVTASVDSTENKSCQINIRRSFSTALDIFESYRKMFCASPVQSTGASHSSIVINSFFCNNSAIASADISRASSNDKPSFSLKQLKFFVQPILNFNCDN